jgi:hypothetical protein
MKNKPVLMTDGRRGLLEPGSVSGVKSFLDKHLHEPIVSASAR